MSHKEYKETNTWKCALLSIFSTIAVAWIAGFLAYRVGLILFV